MRRGDELARRRQELPWVPIKKEYSFDTDDGQKTLAELFGGRSQLLVYHFMFGYGARLTDERRGCTGCSLVADHFDGVIPHLNGRGITLACASIAPLQELLDYRRQMGWRSGEFRRSGATSTTTSASPSPRNSRETEPTTTTGMSKRPSRRRRG
jgi:predicted dithiol-disulfide oxidoreductase (DUF899 family)